MKSGKLGGEQMNAQIRYVKKTIPISVLTL